MGKRSDYERVERDFYPTPWQAVEPLVPHLPKNFAFAEPCAGDGALVRHIETLIDGAWCSWASDIEPQTQNIVTRHFRELIEDDFEDRSTSVEIISIARELTHSKWLSIVQSSLNAPIKKSI